MMNLKSKYFIILLALIATVVLAVYIVLPVFSATNYVASEMATTSLIQKPWQATHIQTPKVVKALYLSSWVAGSPKLRKDPVALAESTEINSLVIDIKDSTGQISFKTENPDLKFAVENRIPDLKEFIEYLHSKNIYVIGRIAVFQDPLMVKKMPEIAVKKNSEKTSVWEDYKGISWIDAGSKKYWEYIVSVGKEARYQGFDELNFDYIRFPSDGNMEDVYYPESNGLEKPTVIRNFFNYLHQAFAGTGITISADLFGMTTTNNDDLGIGQVLENATPFFDAVAPMVYPSHYPPGFMNFKNPADHPYDVVKYSMDTAWNRSSTSVAILRPWLQDFNLGATYNESMIRAQKKAVYDAGLTSWMMWNASSRYTKSAYDIDTVKVIGDSIENHN